MSIIKQVIGRNFGAVVKEVAELVAKGYVVVEREGLKPYHMVAGMYNVHMELLKDTQTDTQEKSVDGVKDPEPEPATSKSDTQTTPEQAVPVTTEVNPSSPTTPPQQSRKTKPKAAKAAK